jgi:iron complex outermembrane recepter protein
MTPNKNRTLRVEAFTRTLLAGLGAQLIVITPLLAQSGSTNGSAELEKMVIIGSNIPTAELETAQPTEVFTREKIDQMGVTSVADLLQRLPQSDANGLNGANGGFGFAPGATSVSLRGFGENATLVLLNGRRVAPYAYADNGTISFVDLNSMPLEAIESVEILSAGNSAVYGAFYGNTVHEDYGTFKGSFTYGGGNDKTDFLVVADYYHQNDLFSRDRTYSSHADLTSVGGINEGNSYSQPGRFAVPVNAPSLIGTPWYNATGTGTINLVPPANSTGFAKPGDYHAFTPADLYNRDQYIQTLPASQRMGVFGTVNHKIFDEKLEVFGEFTYRHNEEHIEYTPAAIDINGFAPGAGIPLGTLTTNNGVVVKGGQLTIPASNPYNPFGVPITAGRLRMGQYGTDKYWLYTENPRVLGGFRGEINDHFNYETAVSFNRPETTATQGPIVFDLYKVQAALNDPNPATALNLFGGANAVNNPATLVFCR